MAAMGKDVLLSFLQGIKALTILITQLAVMTQFLLLAQSIMRE